MPAVAAAVMPVPALGDRSLASVIDALMAYDHGATDSGIYDPDLKAALKQYLDSLDDDAFRVKVADVARLMLTPERIAAGYGLGEVKGLIDWLSDELQIDL
jgi:hypothetical protein